MKSTNVCILINTEQELESILKRKDRLFILFYAEWCGFSQRFLPIFEKCALETKSQCYRMIVDELPRINTKYQIDVYPTVIFFEDGKAGQRLDGVHGIGLNEQQLRELIHVCERPQ
jgi:thioredoxin-like negative regulator of GroEL